MPGSTQEANILVDAGSCRCAIPIAHAHVVEIMRPLPVEPFGQAARFVRGLARIRGAAVPVVDLAFVLGGVHAGESPRFVVIRAGERSVALHVDAVVGVRALPANELAALPPLLDRADPAVVATIAALDDRLLFVLRESALLSLVPTEVA